jgi:hypothetical protein
MKAKKKEKKNAAAATAVVAAARCVDHPDQTLPCKAVDCSYQALIDQPRK